MALKFELLAVAKCDEPDCTENKMLVHDAEENRVQDFQLAAQHELESCGWNFYGGTRCPKHAACVSTIGE